MDNNITVWLDDIAEKFPQKAGYEDQNKKMTFFEMRSRAIEKASLIVKRGIYKQPIVIYMKKNIDTICAMFAVAYSGNYYIPIDIKMPGERVKKIVEIIKPSLILCDDQQYLEKDFLCKYPCINLENTSQGTQDLNVVLENRDHTKDEDLLYVLFTSGSTGIPKGVPITHRAVMDFITCVKDEFRITSEDVFGNQGPFYFDSSLIDIYIGIRTGATVQIIPEKLFSWPTLLLDYIVEKKITSFLWMPTVLINLARLGALKEKKIDGCVKNVFFGGEVMPNKWLNVWRTYLPDAKFVNLYGPTEATVACTFFKVDRCFSNDEDLPIGKPFKNTEIIVLNEEGQLVLSEKDGVGELYIGGVCLAKGYYDDKINTDKSFVQNPLNKRYKEIFYRTGDIVKYNNYGELVYISRKDNQIKHLGYRIELGEIENAVVRLPGVTYCCCIYDDIKKEIVLFLQDNITLDQIQRGLKKLLPNYMLPTRMIKISKIPININGKIDRNKLKILACEEEIDEKN